MTGRAKAPKRPTKPKTWMHVYAIGDGWVAFSGRKPQRTPNYRHFSETWQEAPSKEILVNIVRKRKSKKRFPDLEPVPLPGYLPK